MREHRLILTRRRARLQQLRLAVAGEQPVATPLPPSFNARYVAGVLAHSKGVSLGMYHDKKLTEEEHGTRAARDENMGVEHAPAFGMSVPLVRRRGKRLAFSQGSAVSAVSVKGYLGRAFQDRLDDAREAMQALADAVPERELPGVCYPLYEAFRPAWHGWGTPGTLDLRQIWSMSRQGAWRRHA